MIPFVFTGTVFCLKLFLIGCDPGEVIQDIASFKSVSLLHNKSNLLSAWPEH